MEEPPRCTDIRQSLTGVEGSTASNDGHPLLDGAGAASAHVVGHSFGGTIAVQLAVDAPDLVRSLVLIEPALQTASMAATFDEIVTPLVSMHRTGERAKAVHLF